ncbi:MAG: hypothetical protein GXY03_15400 [Solirubrobacterales bacterium]|nr:hypothetical protein [Solirubrobacterales bacterium]
MRTRIKRPSPALVVACLALFVALGGVGYAAATINGKNIKNGTIAGKKLKNGAVTTKKLKNGAVAGAKLRNGTVSAAKIRNGAITGAKVRVDTLGKVPSAATADRATTADRAGTADSAGVAAQVAGQETALELVSSTTGPDFDSARSAAPEVTLFQVGALTVYGKCFDSGGSFYAIAFVKTSQNGAVLTAEAGSFLYGSPYLNAGTDEMQRYIYVNSIGANGTMSNPPGTSGYYAAAPNGTAIEGRVNIGVKAGDPPAGNGLYGPGDVCRFAASMTQLS